MVTGYIGFAKEVSLHQVSFAVVLGCHLPPVWTPMGMVWEVMETGWGFCCLTLVSPSLCQCYGYLRNADSPVSADHGTLQEMTITTKAKYDSKCHGVPLVCHKWPCQPGVRAHTADSLTYYVFFNRSVSAVCGLWSTNKLCACGFWPILERYDAVTVWLEPEGHGYTHTCFVCV